MKNITGSYKEEGNSSRVPSQPKETPGFQGLKLSKKNAGHVTWQSPSNIALIKYWGKKKGQIPASPSVSMTLSRAFTRMKVQFSAAQQGRGKLEGYTFEGREHADFAGRLKTYLKSITGLYPFLPDLDLFIESSNSFPHSAGIASSASSMSALALCLTSIEQMLLDSPSGDDSFFRKASYAARLGSGSAARSVYPGYVLWGRHKAVPDSAKEFAVPLNERVHRDFREMKDSILIVDDAPKKVSSSAGHSLMSENPWAAVRYRQAGDAAARMISVLESGDMEEFVKMVEKEALTLHSLMMTSDPPFVLMKPGTLAVIEKVRAFRKDTGIPVAFTLDAGPNVHLLYPASFSEKVRQLISAELLGHCGIPEWIDDLGGTGPRLISKG
jgi:diphosphomevalonate decarboxylase